MCLALHRAPWICKVVLLSGEGTWVSGECRGWPRSHSMAKPGLQPLLREVQIATPRLSKESRDATLHSTRLKTWRSSSEQRDDTRAKKGGLGASRKGDLEPGNQTDSGPNPSSGPATSHSLNVFIHEMGILAQTIQKA